MRGRGGEVLEKCKLWKIGPEGSTVYFFKNVCIPLVKEYRKGNSGQDPINPNTIVTPNTRLLLNGLWLNYQYKNEVNPYHHHGGVYSFAIWMKIPYEFNKLCESPQFKGTDKNNIKAGCFEFEYIDTIGGIRNTTIRLSPEYEGAMVFFPATFRHTVCPFYGTDEPRISIAGNLWFAN